MRDSRNRLIHSESGGIITTYNYDNNGNLLASSDGKVYNYDRFNRLAEAMNPTEHGRPTYTDRMGSGWAF